MTTFKSHCKVCGKPLGVFDNDTCGECERWLKVIEDIKAEIEETIESYVCDKEENTMKAQGMLNAMRMIFEIIDKHISGDKG